MATALERETRLISNGTNIVNNTDSDVNFNFMAEFGGFVRWQVLPRGYIRGGYELWYNSSVFGVDETSREASLQISEQHPLTMIS